MDDIVDINTLFGPLPFASTDLTVDDLLTLMQKHKIASACTLSTLGLLLDPTIGNSATRAACSEHPELLPVATLNPLMYFGDTAAVQRLRADGFRLVRLFPTEQGWPVGFGPFRALLPSLAENGLPLMVNAERPGQITELLAALADYPAPVILAGVEIGTLAEAIVALQQRPNWHVETSRLLGAGCIRYFVDAVGVERLLFGTSAPAQPVAGVLYTLNLAGLPEESRRQVLAGNARRILGNG